MIGIIFSYTVLSVYYILYRRQELLEELAAHNISNDEVLLLCLVLLALSTAGVASILYQCRKFVTRIRDPASASFELGDRLTRIGNEARRSHQTQQLELSNEIRAIALLQANVSEHIVALRGFILEQQQQQQQEEDTASPNHHQARVQESTGSNETLLVMSNPAAEENKKSVWV